MKRYDIRSFYTNENKKQYIVFSTSYISPLKFIKEIEEELSNQVNTEIEVIFDLLLSSGNSKERTVKQFMMENNLIEKAFNILMF